VKFRAIKQKGMVNTTPVIFPVKNDEHLEILKIKESKHVDSAKTN